MRNQVRLTCIVRRTITRVIAYSNDANSLRGCSGTNALPRDEAASGRRVQQGAGHNEGSRRLREEGANPTRCRKRKRTLPFQISRIRSHLARSALWESRFHDPWARALLVCPSWGGHIPNNARRSSCQRAGHRSQHLAVRRCVGWSQHQAVGVCQRGVRSARWLRVG